MALGWGQGEGQSPSPICAPKPSFRRFRCSAWLIHDFAPSPMRALVFRSAYSASRNARASAAFAASIKAHCAVSSETLMLQVRCANPPMPHRTSSSSCSGVPVGLLSYLRAIPPFGALAFRSAYWLSSHHPALRRAGVLFGLLAAPNARPPVASRPTASPNAELQSLRDLRQAQTLDLQVRFAHPPMPHRTSFSSRSGVPHGLSPLSHRLQNAG